MSNLALRVESQQDVPIGGKQERYATLRDTLTDAVSAPFKRARSLIRGEAHGAPHFIRSRFLFNRSLVFLVVFFSITIIWFPNSPKLQPIPGRDSGVFLYTASRLVDGEVPYRDAWDHKGPMIFFTNAMGLLLTDSRWGVWAIEVLTLGSTVLMGFSLIRKAFPLTPTLIGVFVFISSLPHVSAGGNKTEQYVILLQLIALYAFQGQTFKNQGHSWRNWVLGSTMAIAFLFQGNLVVTWAVIILLIIGYRVYAKQSRALLIQGVEIASGFLIAIAPVLLFFLVHDSAIPFLSAVFEYNFVYSSAASWGDRIISPLYGFQALGPSGIAFVGLIAFIMALNSIFRRTKQSASQFRLILVSVFAFPLEAFASSFSGQSWHHYFLTWLPSLMILTTFLANILLNALDVPDSREKARGFLAIESRTAMGYAVILTMLTQGLGLWLVNDFAKGILFEKDKDEVVNYIEKNTADDDFVLIWGAETKYNFATDRPSPTRFNYQYALLRDGYSDASLINGFVEELEATPPIIIIDSSPSNPVFPPLDFNQRSTWSNVSTVYKPIPELASFFSFVETNYSAVDTMKPNNWIVYRRMP